MNYNDENEIRPECQGVFNELYKLINNHYVTLKADQKAIKWLLGLVLPLLVSISIAMIVLEVSKN